MIVMSGHVEHMGEKIYWYKMSVGKPEGWDHCWKV